eukprot:gb/GECG01006684.1/.p1 GENE.gb/GECG01006684.1/~~gb/GECG01006684.1/.p1  ORF type:complete len:422 (+),score=41.95 gb/GECG01006684.1/:1-1266(+)
MKKKFLRNWSAAVASEGIERPRPPGGISDTVSPKCQDSPSHESYGSKGGWRTPQQSLHSPVSVPSASPNGAPSSGERRSGRSYATPVNDNQMRDIVERLSPVKRTQSPLARSPLQACHTENHRGTVKHSPITTKVGKSGRDPVYRLAFSDSKQDQRMRKAKRDDMGTRVPKPVNTRPAELDHPLQSPGAKYYCQKRRTRKKLELSVSCMAKLEGKFFFGTVCPVFENYRASEDDQTGLMSYMSEFPCPRHETRGVAYHKIDNDDRKNAESVQNIFKRMMTPFRKPTQPAGDPSQADRPPLIQASSANVSNSRGKFTMDSLKGKLQSAFQKTFVPRTLSPTSVRMQALEGLQQQSELERGDSASACRSTVESKSQSKLKREASPEGIILSPLRGKNTQHKRKDKHSSSQQQTVCNLLDEFSL